MKSFARKYRPASEDGGAAGELDLDRIEALAEQ